MDIDEPLDLFPFDFHFNENGDNTTTYLEQIELQDRSFLRPFEWSTSQATESSYTSADANYHCDHIFVDPRLTVLGEFPLLVDPRPIQQTQNNLGPHDVTSISNETSTSSDKSRRTLSSRHYNLLMRRRRNVGNIQGNNQYGRKGTIGCMACRKHRQKVHPCSLSLAH